MYEPSIAANRLCWNGIAVELDPVCDITIKNESHLIIEYQFSPLAEIRWSPVRNNRRRNKSFRVLHNDLNAHYKRLVSAATVPYQALNRSFEMVCYQTNRARQPQRLLILRCKTCAARMMLHCSENSETAHLAEMLYQTLRCTHPGTDQDQIWQIQDFYFLVPERYSLISHSFSPGNSIVSFANGSTTLHYARLVPGLTSHDHRDCANLFSSLTGLVQEQVVSKNNRLSGGNCPSRITRILALINRRKIFQWGQGQHFIQELTDPDSPVSTCCTW